MNFKKSKKWTLLESGKPMVLVQKWPFFQLSFFGNIGQENLFNDILERKNASGSYKNQKNRRVEKLTFFPRG